jgi:hypothetical protein
MASAPNGIPGAAGAGALLLACAAAQGTAAHPWPSNPELLKSEDSARSLADAIHLLCILHGRYPGVIDHAALRVVEPGARAWLARASYAFAGERAYIARLAVAAGPVPGTPGAAGSDSTVLSQRHAIEMLAQSERNGCALGAAMGLVLDWASVRTALDAAARRFGVEPPPYAAGDAEAAADAADSFAVSPAAQRALLFGAEQVLVQHHGLWDLIEARHQARAAAA